MTQEQAKQLRFLFNQPDKRFNIIHLIKKVIPAPVVRITEEALDTEEEEFYITTSFNLSRAAEIDINDIQVHEHLPSERWLKIY